IASQHKFRDILRGKEAILIERRQLLVEIGQRPFVEHLIAHLAWNQYDEAAFLVATLALDGRLAILETTERQRERRLILVLRFRLLVLLLLFFLVLFLVFLLVLGR